MRVLHVVHSARAGGATANAVALATNRPSGMTAQGVVFLEDGPAVAGVQAAGVHAEVVETGRMRQPWRWTAAVGALRASIRDLRADIVLAHVTKAHVFAAAAARLEGVPEVWWQQEHHGLNPPLQQVAGRIRSPLVICSAAWTAEAQLARFPRSPVCVIHPSALSSADVGAGHVHTAEAAPVYAVLGRLARWKRVELAIESFARVVGELPAARLMVVGGEDDDGYQVELERQVAALGISAAVTFCGHVSGGPVAALADVDVLVHCARLEPFGMAPVEALALGIPVAGIAEGGLNETVRDRVDGLLVNGADTAALGRAMVELGTDSALRQRLGDAGRARALERYATDFCAAETWRALRGVLEQEARGGGDQAGS